MAIETTGDAFAAATRIAGNTRSNVKGLWFFAVLWNLVSAPMLVFVPPELERQPLAALGFLFPVVGAGLIAWAVITTARWRRFGNTWLDTPEGPAHPGSTWRATVHARLPQDRQADEPLRVKLTCLRRTISRHGSDRDEREHILWREEAELNWTRVGFGADGASIPVQFDIPADALETTAVGKGEGILWVLTVEAALPGVNLKEDFDVPVRRWGAGGAGGSGGSKDPQLRTTAEAVPGVTLDDLARTGIRVEPSPEGMRFTFGRMRNLSFAAGLTLFTAVWTGALWVQWSLGFPWIFPILTGLIDLLLIYSALELWLGMSVVTAGHGALRVRHSLLGIGGTRVIPAADIAAIELHISMQTQGRHGTPYYQVRARLASGRKASLGSGIRNKRHAEWLAAQMRAAIGVK
jgi:hypothetical protein